MAVREIPLSSLDLLTAQEVATRFSKSVEAVHRWAQNGDIPVVVTGTGRHRVYLFRVADVDAFTLPKRGKGSPKWGTRSSVRVARSRDRESTPVG